MTTLKGLFKIEAHASPFYILIILILAVFFMGGSSRSDVESLIILRPLFVIGGGIAFCTLHKRHFLDYKNLLILVIIFIILHFFYLFPFSLFQEHILDKFQRDDLGFENGAPLYYIMALDPEKFINSIFAIVIPISVIIIAIQLRASEHIFFLKFIIVLACLGGIVGFFQIIGGTKNFLYLYEVSNLGSSVGLFANRNHQGVFLGLLLTMLAAYASLGDRSSKNGFYRNWVAISCSALIIPLILITGSRGGLLVGLVAIVISYFIYRKEALPRQKSRQWQVLGALFGVIGIGVMTVIMSRAEAWDRLFNGEEFGGGRSGFWALTVQIVGEYFPFGTGPGGFSAAFTSSENLILLDPTYLNHAHNDWLEWIVTFGLPGIMFMVLALALFLLSVVRKWRDPGENNKSRLLLKLGVSIIMLIGLASVGDYPIRTPIFSCIFALALCWTMGRHVQDQSTAAPLPSKFQDGNSPAPRKIKNV